MNESFKHPNTAAVVKVWGETDIEVGDLVVLPSDGKYVISNYDGGRGVMTVRGIHWWEPAWWWIKRKLDR